jgi:hypothetical protein
MSWISTAASDAIRIDSSSSAPACDNLPRSAVKPTQANSTNQAVFWKPEGATRLRW